jgi:hypothetical protein
LAEKIKSTSYDKKMVGDQKTITEHDLNECSENDLESLVEILSSLITHVIEKDQLYLGESEVLCEL